MTSPPIYLALAGLLDPRELPCPPMLPALIRPAVRFMERRFHSGILMVSGQLGMITRRLRGDWGRYGPPDGDIARRFCARTLALLAVFHNDDGSWNANTVQTALALPALLAAGLPHGHPMVEKHGRMARDPACARRRGAALRRLLELRVVHGGEPARAVRGR